MISPFTMIINAFSDYQPGQLQKFSSTELSSRIHSEIEDLEAQLSRMRTIQTLWELHNRLSSGKESSNDSSTSIKGYTTIPSGLYDKLSRQEQLSLLRDGYITTVLSEDSVVVVDGPTPKYSIISCRDLVPTW